METGTFIQVEFLWDLLVSIVMVYFFDVDIYPASWMEATDAFHRLPEGCVCAGSSLSTSATGQMVPTSPKLFRLFLGLE